mmetsp:Transcript_35450/g.40997  ORF Transcript_35450/g.40997 Transcript_35450/m.40997 type:complete len:287 (+) Transcript_35450:403-1263(+)
MRLLLLHGALALYALRGVPVLRDARVLHDEQALHGAHALPDVRALRDVRALHDARVLLEVQELQHLQALHYVEVHCYRVFHVDHVLLYFRALQHARVHVDPHPYLDSHHAHAVRPHDGVQPPLALLLCPAAHPHASHLLYDPRLGLHDEARHELDYPHFVFQALPGDHQLYPLGLLQVARFPAVGQELRQAPPDLPLARQGLPQLYVLQQLAVRLQFLACLQLVLPFLLRLERVVLRRQLSLVLPQARLLGCPLDLLWVLMALRLDRQQLRFPVFQARLYPSLKCY